MFRKKSVFGVLMTFLVILVLIAGGFALFRLGFAQGYSSGIITEGDGGALAYPDGFQRGFGHPYAYPMGFFGFGRLIGLFFFIGLLFMIFGGIRRMFWCRPWRFAGGPDSEKWKEWYRHHPAAHKWGPPPWAGDEKPADIDDEADEASEEVESE